MGWINSIKGKYVLECQRTSPILRIENVVIINENKKYYYLVVLIENLYLVFTNIFLRGLTTVLQDFYSFNFHLLILHNIKFSNLFICLVKKENISL